MFDHETIKLVIKKAKQMFEIIRIVKKVGGNRHSK